jgi:hypothetical protein
MRIFTLLLLVGLLAGCAVIEKSPDDVQHQLSDPTSGHLYVPEPVR